jgi:16S rRNA (guanine527-N7)-methyltransferase
MNHSALVDLAAQAGLNITLTVPAFERLAAFLERRARWAGTHNLSGPRALRDPWLVDVLDGLALTQVMLPDLPLVDVGAGSGIPGLLIACLDPTQVVHLVESLAKRTAFLRTTAVQMGLKNVHVHRARWPLQIPGPQQLVSRAVVGPAVWPALAASAGPQVEHILRFLADKRPPMALPGFTLEASIDYTVDTAPRRIERWAGQGTTAGN